MLRDYLDIKRALERSGIMRRLANMEGKQIWTLKYAQSVNGVLPDDLGNITISAGGIKLTDLSATPPLTYNNATGVFGIQKAGTLGNGYLSSTDWNTFNNKEPKITAGTTSQYYRGDKTFQTLNQAAVAGLTTTDSPTFAGLTDSGLSAGQVVYAGTAGLLSTDPNFLWDTANSHATIQKTTSSTNAASAAFTIENPAGSQSNLSFTFAGTRQANIRCDNSGSIAINGNDGIIYLFNDFGADGNGQYNIQWPATNIGNTKYGLNGGSAFMPPQGQTGARIQLFHDGNAGNPGEIYIESGANGNMFWRANGTRFAKTITSTGNWIFGTSASTNGKIQVEGVAYLAEGGSTSFVRGGGSAFDHFADVSSSTTVETDIYTDSIPASTLGVNGDKLKFEYSGVTVASATATREFKLYFAGTALFDSTGLTINAAADWNMKGYIIRDSSTTIRSFVKLTIDGITTEVYQKTNKLTGLTLTGANILKVTGQAGGAGAATGDIVGQSGFVEWISSATA